MITLSLRKSLTAATIAAATGVLPMPFTPTAAAADCPDIEVVFARGTDEPAGIGRVGQAFVNSLRSQVGNRNVGVYAVNYPATYDFLAAADGANDASGHIQWMIGNCPNTRMVLGGYSQGAAVMDVIAAIPVPGIGFNAPLPPNAPAHVAAIAVFGNPTTKLGLPMTASPVWGSRAIDLCNGGDPVCSSGRNIAAHSNYDGSGLAGQGAGFVASLV